MQKTLLVSLLFIFLFSFQLTFSQADAGPDQYICEDYTYMQAVNPTPSSGFWTVISGAGTFTDPTLYNTLVTGISTGSNTFRWQVGGDFDDVVITNNLPTDAVIVTPIITNREVCSNLAAVEGTNPVFGSGMWTVSTSIFGTYYTNSANYQTVINDLRPGNNVITWTISNGICSSVDQITIINNEVTSEAGSDQILCADNTFLNATDPSTIYPNQGVGHWTNLSANGAVIDNPLQNNTAVSNIPSGITTLQWTVELGSCSMNDLVQISNNSVIATANNQTDCDGTFILDGNDPSSFGGTGFWEIVDGGSGTISAPSTLYNTTITGISNGVTTTLRWNVDNGICTDDIEVTVTNNNFSVDAGPDQNICSYFTQMNADNPLSGTGFWTLISGSGVFQNNSDFDAIVTGVGQGTNTYRWTVTGDGCTNFDEVIVTNNSPSIATITGPIGTETCDGTITLTANLPAPYYADNQYWEIVSGGGIFNDPSTSFTMDVTNLYPGNNIFRWAVERGTCPNSEDFITIVNNQVSAVAGASQIICADNTFLNATNPSSIYPFQGTGYWTNISGNAAIIANSLLENSAITNLPVGTTTFQWNVELGTCSESDQVQITNNSVTATALDAETCNSYISALTGNIPGPGESGIWTCFTPGVTYDNQSLYNTGAHNLGVGINNFTWTINNADCSDAVSIIVDYINPITNAGPNQNLCSDNTFMAAQNPSPGIGFWTVQTGSGTFTNSLAYNTFVSNIGVGVNVYVWSVTEKACTKTDMVIINNNSPVAYAGSDLITCFSTAVLHANQEQSGETAFWTKIGGTGIITTPTLFNSQVTNLSPGNNVFRWTVDNSLCLNSDEVTIINNKITDVNAGVDQNTCETYATLSALAPQIGESGYWTVAGGTAVFDNSALYTTDVTGLVQGDNRLVWTLTNGLCNARDTVVVTNNSPTVSNVSADAEICSNIYTLVGNSTAVGETGLWTAEFGASATIVDPTNNITTAHSIGAGSNTFRWTISNALCDSFDDIVVTNNTITGDAGLDTEVCTDYLEFPIAENNYWTYISACGSITENTTTNVWEINLCQGENELELTVTQGICSASDTLIITNNSVEANAGLDVITCGEDANLSANDLLPGETGLWTIIGGSGTILTPSNNETIVTNQSSGVSVYQWTVNGNACTDSDIVQVNENSFLIETGPAQTVCSDEGSLFILEFTEWELELTEGCAAFVDTIDNQVFFTDLCLGENVFVFTAYLNGCYASDSYIINNSSVEANAGPDETITTDSYQLKGENPYQGIGTWSVLAGSGIFDDDELYNTIVSELSEGENVFNWTVSLNNCTDSDDVTITYNPLGVEDLNSIFKVFPNPTDGLISISSTTDLSDAVFELKNIAGQEVQYKMIEQTSHAFRIDLSNLTYGVYFLKINLKGETKMLRLVKK